MSVLVLVSLAPTTVSYLIGMLGVLVITLVAQANASALEMFLLSRGMVVLVAM
jgi:hypothetical protein